jgi:hypothetical protein
VNTEPGPDYVRYPVKVTLDRLVGKVDVLILAYLRQNDIDSDRVEVVSPTEVIVHNQRVR